MGKVVCALGGELLVPHIDVGCVKMVFGEQRKVDQFALLEQITRVGVPVDVGPEGDLEQELAYGNHSSARKYVAEVWENIVGDAKKGRAIVMPVKVARMARGLRMNPVGMVEEKGNRRMVHDSTFRGELEARGAGGGRLTKRRTGTRYFRNATWRVWWAKLSIGGWGSGKKSG